MHKSGERRRGRMMFDKRLVAVLFGVLFFGTCSATVWAELNQWASYGPMGGSAFSLSVDPQNPTTLYATSIGPVFKSADGGASWHTLNPESTPSGIGPFVFDPTNSNTIYAGSFNHGRVYKT